MKADHEIESLKSKVLGGDWKIANEAAKLLANIGGDIAFDFFISLLGMDIEDLRNVAALALLDIGDDKAVESLIVAILKKENIKRNGTMVYALQHLDCRNKFKEMFEILFYHGYEARVHAYQILTDQEMNATASDISDIVSQWEYIKSHPREYGDVTERQKMIEDVLSEYCNNK